MTESQDDTFQRLIREHGRCVCTSSFCEGEEGGGRCALCAHLPDSYWPCPHDPDADYPKPIIGATPAAEPDALNLPTREWAIEDEQLKRYIEDECHRAAKRGRDEALAVVVKALGELEGEYTCAGTVTGDFASGVLYGLGDKLSRRVEREDMIEAES